MMKRLVWSFSLHVLIGLLSFFFLFFPSPPPRPGSLLPPPAPPCPACFLPLVHYSVAVWCCCCKTGSTRVTPCVNPSDSSEYWLIPDYSSIKGGAFMRNRLAGQPIIALVMSQQMRERGDSKPFVWHWRACRIQREIGAVRLLPLILPHIDTCLQDTAMFWSHRIYTCSHLVDYFVPRNYVCRIHPNFVDVT